MEYFRNSQKIDRVEKYGNLSTKDDSIKELIQAAICGRKFAYARYSDFKVGAAIRTKCGRIFTGCNVENAAFTPTACAERTAITKAVSEGYLQFAEVAVVAWQANTFTTPCGVCRQFIMEFAEEDIPIYVARAQDDITKIQDDDVLCTSIYNLLPSGFHTFKDA